MTGWCAFSQAFDLQHSLHAVDGLEHRMLCEIELGHGVSEFRGVGEAALENLQFQDHGVEVVPQVVRKKGKIFFLAFGGGPQPFFLAVDERDDAALQHRIDRHVQGQILHRRQPPGQDFFDLIHQDPAKQAVFDDEPARIVLLLETRVSVLNWALQQPARFRGVVLRQQVGEQLQHRRQMITQLRLAELSIGGKQLQYGRLPCTDDLIDRRTQR